LIIAAASEQIIAGYLLCVGRRETADADHYFGSPGVWTLSARPGVWARGPN
jgi:hypothetical protein